MAQELAIYQRALLQKKASQADTLHVRHVTGVGGLCELHLNLAKWKQTKHIVCVRMKASLRRAVTEGSEWRMWVIKPHRRAEKHFSKRSSQHEA